jgi:mannose/fructose/N-acetylgalactosamine-specific phosphotransferase system component IIB
MISLIRIDDRLIHGQVMAVWARVLSVTHIVVADDGAAADSFSQQVMQLAVPSSITLVVTSVAGAAALLGKAAGDNTRTMVLLKSVESAGRLHASYAYAELNVGGIGMVPGRKLVWRSIAASPAELNQLRALSKAGVDVYWQMIPTDEKRRLTDDGRRTTDDGR